MNATLTFVSAGAGSGKTYRLTKILHEELKGGVRPAGVIATTYTRKAATELRERARTSLLDLGEFELANGIGQARIGTVNAVCGQLLERFAFEAGLPTELRVLEEAQAVTLIREANDAVLDGRTYDEINQIAVRLGIEEWEERLKELVDKARANDIAPERIPAFAKANADDLLSYFPQPTTTDLDVALKQAIDAALPAVRETAARGGKRNTNEYLGLVDEVRRGLDYGTLPWAQWVKLSKTAPEAGLRSAVANIAETAGRFAEHPGLHADIRAYLEHQFQLCARVLAVYAARKVETGVLDFTDQEQLLLKILDAPSVSATLREELDLLLVDEFQDTSPIQLALFVKLAGFARRTYWVGDVKQAIYGFRGSDTALMQAVVDALAALGGEKQILDESRRSRPSLVELVNCVFTKAFSSSLPADEVRLKPVRAEVGHSQVLANWMLDGSNVADRGAALARGVREFVESGYVVHDRAADIERPVRYGDVVILSRKNDKVQEIAAALTAEGVPAATSQPGLLTRPEAVLAMACLRRLNDAGDTIATAEILSLAECQEPAIWLSDRLKHLAAGGNAASWAEDDPGANPLLARLASLRSQLPLLSPREALQLVIIECELPSRVLSWCADESSARVRLANLEQLVRLAADYEDLCTSNRSAATISGLITWFHEQQQAGLDDLAEPAIDAVKVLTHHGAKGLEWPVVILTDLETNVRTRLWGVTVSSPEKLEVADPLQDRFIRYWPWPFGKQQKVAVATVIEQSEVAQKFQRAAVEEDKRLLYVSMTRARDLLVLARNAAKPSGPWIEVLDAPWLLPGEKTESIDLPGGGTARCEYREFAPSPDEEPAPSEPRSLYWYPTVTERTARLPLFVNPSRAEQVSCNAGEPVIVGTRIALKAGTDMTALGNAIHACIAAAFADRRAPLSITDVERIVSGAALSERVSAAAVHGQVGALATWVDARWPGCKALPEVSIESVLGNGQVLRGQIDLLLQTDAGWILIDHKSNPGGLPGAQELARGFSGQLHAYSEAVKAATGKPVVEVWLYLPVAGGAIRVFV